ncbi:MAG TPA: ISL3 family transposase [bacterium]|nr:ISL3 family transposase [bacterium]
MELAGFDHAEARTCRHLDTCQFQTHLHAEIPRVQCPTHGVKQVRVPWAEPRSCFTLLMERLVIDLILQCSTVKGACAIAGISWDEAWGIMQRAVARGQARKQARPIAYLGVDEKAFRKGHRSHTVVCDLERSTVEFVAEDRKTESLAAYYEQLADTQKAAVRAVAMDMWDPYIGATREDLPDGEARIVYDRFHIMREISKAVDTVCKQEHRAFLQAGEDSPLTGTKYVWLYSDENRPEHQAEPFATLQALNLKVGRAWAIKEALRTLWTYRQTAAVKRFFSRWYAWAVRSRLEPVKEVAATLKRHLEGVLRLVKHPVTNGVAEGLNSKIMSIKRKAGGFRNSENFTTAILFPLQRLGSIPTLIPRKVHKNMVETNGSGPWTS